MINNFDLKAIAIFLIFSSLSCNFTQKTKATAHNKHIIIKGLNASIFKHISFLNTESFGKVACNGMVVISNEEAIVIDCPTDDSGSIELINWIEKSKKCKIKAVVCTHFHVDCLGGLNEFHKRNIPSYANSLTLTLARENGFIVPKNGFKDSLILKVGDKQVANYFLGAGHTKGNIVSYVPSEKVLFGGCLIKALGANKGNLADADTSEWPKTLAKVQVKFPNVKTIIPGHGLEGDTSLFAYTINLFKIN